MARSGRAEVAVDHRVEALVVVGAGAGGPTAARGRIEALRRAGAHVLVVGDGAAEVEAGAWLGARGLTGALVLRLTQDDLAERWALDLLDDQVRRWRERRVPAIDDDPAWVVELPGDERRGRVAESIGTLANGRFGLRAALEEDGPGATPLLVAGGVYTRDPVPVLVAAPVWTGLDLRGAAAGRRRLDLRNGLLARDDATTGLRSLRFVSAARLDAMALRAEGPVAVVSGGDPPARDRRGDPRGGGVAVAVHDRSSVAAGRRVVERVAAGVADPVALPSLDEAGERLEELVRAGFDGLLAEHRAAWAARWADVEVSVEGDEAAQLAARFAVFHLLGAAAEGDEAAVGARGLTGPAYGGHVFWDADVFVLPALAALRPGAARAMVAYRVRRLPAARAAAVAQGLAGARFPWESAGDGSEVTPTSVDRQGRLVPVLTDDHEEHIVADVAWAADALAGWTGAEVDDGPRRRLLAETARYWVARAAREPDAGHLRGVMGPDEYHDLVDDDVFTNVLARWNLRRAAEVVGGAEAPVWRALAARLVDGWDPDRQCHEQFAGYGDLEPLLAAQVAPVPFAADLLLGTERVAGSQLIKQPDVLMAHHLVPDELRPGSLARDLAHYEPRTVHGSSLSPAVHASLHARAGNPDRGLELFRLAARLDLDDLTGTTAGGLHLATMGGLWQALAHGFLGLRPRGEVLHVDPCLPTSWTALALRFRFRGQRVGVRAAPDAVRVTCEAPLALDLRGRRATCPPPGLTLALDDREASP